MLLSIHPKWLLLFLVSAFAPAHDRLSSIPETRGNLTVSWTNLITGDGSTTLAHDGNVWVSACANQLRFEVDSRSGRPELRVTYYLSGSCPDGQGQSASTALEAPFRLIRDDSKPVEGGAARLLRAEVTSAGNPNLAAFGYTSFAVTRKLADGVGVRE